MAKINESMQADVLQETARMTMKAKLHQERAESWYNKGTRPDLAVQEAAMASMYTNSVTMLQVALIQISMS